MNLTFRIQILLFFVGHYCQANMSSPILEGTRVSSAISSKDINILSETIYIKTDRNFQTAKFTIEYIVRADIAGKQIPLLFHAQDFRDSFLVWVDNIKVDIQQVPYFQIEDSPFSGFRESLEKSSNGDKVTIYWQENIGDSYYIHDLKYFETDLEKGIHKIKIEYVANSWLDISTWVKEYSFRYSLSPAKFWKSFGSLKIVVKQEGEAKQITSNLGLPDGKNVQAISVWTFSKIPDKYFTITYVPETTILAKILILIGPVGLSSIVGVFLCWLHLRWMRSYRRKKVTSNYSSVVIVGSIVIPFLFLVSFICSYDLIDFVIGENAGRHHGYIFVMIIFYPVLLLFYWIVMWLLDRQQKRRLTNSTNKFI
jgi:hypothetical protein